jgi:large subunit ribosomal protein L4
MHQRGGIRSIALQTPDSQLTNIKHSRRIHASNPNVGAKGITYPTDIPAHLAPKNLLTTLYTFPTLAPLKFLEYSPSLLGVPLRKDILHRAVIYEGDKTRQGTANTKWRSEVHGSNRKIRPQKGTGRARLGDKKSPMLRGGGVAFGPKPRDFSTELPKKVYDLAWRTALSYRYRKGELVVVDNLRIPQEGLEQGMTQHWLQRWLEVLKWDRKNAGSLLITKDKTDKNESLFRALNKELDRQGMVRSSTEVDVKNLLGMGRVIIERTALNAILKKHAPARQIGSVPTLTTSVGSQELTSGFDQAIMQEMVIDFAQFDLDQETADVQEILEASEEDLQDLEETYDLAEEEPEPPRIRV